MEKMTSSHQVPQIAALRHRLAASSRPLEGPPRRTTLSGSGKTTTASLLCGFYNADTGKILVDDTDIGTVRLNSYRRQLGIVFQDAFLFYSTILLMQSVTLGTREIGLRIALGSGRKAILLSLLLPISMEIGVGLMIGALATELMRRTVRQVLQISSPAVPALVLSAGAILVIAMIAAVTPMRRAVQIDPIQQ